MNGNKSRKLKCFYQRLYLSQKIFRNLTVYRFENIFKYHQQFTFAFHIECIFKSAFLGSDWNPFNLMGFWSRWTRVNRMAGINVATRVLLLFVIKLAANRYLKRIWAHWIRISSQQRPLKYLALKTVSTSPPEILWEFVIKLAESSIQGFWGRWAGISQRHLQFYVVSKNTSFFFNFGIFNTV